MASADLTNALVQPIILKYSATAGNKPTTANLYRGELALNVADGILYTVKAGATEDDDTIIAQKLGHDALSTLEEVVIASAADKQALVYNATDSKWHNVTLTHEYISDFATAVGDIVDTKIADFHGVTLDTAQTITGAKTFTATPQVKKGEAAAVDVLIASDIGTTVQGYNANLDKLNALTDAGIVVKTTDGYVARTITSSDLTVTNGDGADGNVTIALKDSGVTAGDYTKVTVNAKGAVTAGSNPTTLEGYGITDAVSKAGDTVTGTIKYGDAVTITADKELVTKEYVDGAITSKVSSALKYKGTKATVDDLPTTGNEIGDVWNVDSNGANYAWSGTEWDKLSETLDLSVYFKKTDIIPIAQGGTGASTKAGGFDALAPTAAKGDLIVHNGTGNVALSAGANNSILVADSTSATGYSWATAISGGTF